MIDFNVNDYVLVRLTDHGRKMLRKDHDRLWTGRAPPYEFKLPTEDADGWSRWPLWGLMEAFGTYTNMGSPLCFETEIRLEAPGETESLRRDAARYTYLRNRVPAEVLGQVKSAAGCWIDGEDEEGVLVLLTGDDADAAVDAAMAAQK